MKFVDYQCATCGYSVELDVDDPETKEQQTSCSQCHGNMKRLWNTPIHVPDHMRAGNEVPWNYEKRGFRHQKYFPGKPK